MSRLNGGYIGYDAEPTITAAAPGIWTLREAEFYQRKAQWTINSPPSQVTGLAVDSTGDGTIDMSWSAPASEAAITDYRVEYTPSGGSATEVLVGSAATSYQLTGLTNDTEYSVRVAAISAGGQGDYSTAVTGTPVAVTVIDLTPLAVSVTNGDRIELQNLDSAYPEIYGSAPQNGNYDFGAFGWQIAELTFYGGISPSGPFPIQLPSHSLYYVTLSDIGGPGRSLRFYRNSGKIEISVDSDPCIIGGNVRIDITNIVFEKVTDGVVTHRLGPYASGPFYSSYCSD